MDMQYLKDLGNAPMRSNILALVTKRRLVTRGNRFMCQDVRLRRIAAS